MDGLGGILDRGQAFHFLLYLREAADVRHEESDLIKPERLPLGGRGTTGPHFTSARKTEPDATPAPVLAFLEAAHQLYLEKETDLVEATRERKANRARQRKNKKIGPVPQPPENLVVEFWHSEPKPLPAHLQPKGKKEAKR